MLSFVLIYTHTFFLSLLFLLSISMSGMSGMNGMLTQSQIQSESRQACDPRINMDEYAYNKIFVGGLHYDTRDGKS